MKAAELIYRFVPYNVCILNAEHHRSILYLKLYNIERYIEYIRLLCILRLHSFYVADNHFSIFEIPTRVNILTFYNGCK